MKHWFADNWREKPDDRKQILYNFNVENSRKITYIKLDGLHVVYLVDKQQSFSVVPAASVIRVENLKLYIVFPTLNTEVILSFETLLDFYRNTKANYKVSTHT
jgi:hypothetical protein